MALRIPPLPSPKDLLKLYKIRARKRLAQNFLLEKRLTDKIVKYAGKLRDAQVLEVGPGPASITSSIMRKSPKRIVLVEKDERFKPTLDMMADAFGAYGRQMDIIYDDIRKVDISRLFHESEKRDWTDRPPDIFVIGNLPFNVATPLIIQWLHAISTRTGPWAFGRTKLTLTFQKEVAERIVAPPANMQRCRLSVMAQAWTFPVYRFTIPGRVFIPKPEVDVGVVTFTPLVRPITNHDFKLFEKVTRHIFIRRQRYNIKCIGNLFPLDCREELSTMMCRLADVNPETRSFHLTVEEIDRLTTAYKYLGEKHPHILQYDCQASRRILRSTYTKNVTVTEEMDVNFGDKYDDHDSDDSGDFDDSEESDESVESDGYEDSDDRGNSNDTGNKLYTT